MGKIVENFVQQIPLLSHAEKHVLYYIEGNLDEAKKQSLTELATSTDVSTTTVVRMCQKLGLQGFSELKFLLKTIAKVDSLDETDPILQYQQNVEETLSNVNRESIAAICELLKKADKVVIIAVGLSKMTGEYFSKLLMQMNKPTFYAYESHIIDLIPNMSHPNDLVILISSSGETKTIVQVAEKLKYQNQKTVAFTNQADCSLAKLVTHVISAHTQLVQYAGYDLTIRSSLMILVDLIVQTYLLHNSKEK